MRVAIAGAGAVGRSIARELLENGHGRRLVVDKHPSLARGQNFAAQDDLVSFGVNAVILKHSLSSWRGFENACDYSLVGSMAHDFRRGLSPHQECQRIYKNGLASARFAGQKVQPRAKNGDGMIDNSVIFGA